MAGPYLSWSCSMANCQLHLSVLYGTMQVHYVCDLASLDTSNLLLMFHFPVEAIPIYVEELLLQLTCWVECTT